MKKSVIAILGYVALVSMAYAETTPVDKTSSNIAFVRIDPNTTFLINSTLLERQPAFSLGDAQWLIPTAVGPIRLDEKTGSIQFTRLDLGGSENSRVTSLAKAGDKYLVGSMNHGAFILDPKKITYESNFNIGEIQSFATGKNLEFTQETGEAEIWTSTFLELHRYDQKGATWSSLNHIFSDLNGGQGSALHQILLDPPYIWIQAAAHNKSKGGLFQLDQRSGHWSIYRGELVSAEVPPSRIDVLSMIASPRALWVYLYQGNAYNFYLARYDKQGGYWQSFHKAGIGEAIDRLIEDLPNSRWIRKRPILSELLTVVDHPMELGHPHSFSKQDWSSLNATVAKLKAAFKKIDPNMDEARGFPRHSAQHGWILKGQSYSSNEPVHKLGFEPLTYKMLIAPFGNRVVVNTDKGLGVLDAATLRVELFNPPVMPDQPTFWSFSRDKTRFDLCEYFEGEDGPDVIHTYKFDLQSMRVIKDSIVENAQCPGADKDILSTHKLSSGVTVDLAWDGVILRGK